MRDQIIVSENGQSGIAVPLYRRHEEHDLIAGFSISLYEDKPLAYAIDFGPEIGKPFLANAQFVESRFVVVGDFESPADTRKGEG